MEEGSIKQKPSSQISISEQNSPDMKLKKTNEHYTKYLEENLQIYSSDPKFLEL